MIKKRFLINVPTSLLDAVDRQAAADYMSRSELVRRALLEYLRPIDGQLDEHQLFTDPEEILRILQQRRLRASLQKMQREVKRERRLVGQKTSRSI
jgi:metal-responsive CopG/Arc/MetJ family transcriptional regulator